MKKKAFTFMIFTIALMINSCKKENLYDCFKTSNHVETKEREVSGFRKIRVEDKFDVFVTQGQEYKVTIEAGKDLHANIKTDVIDSILYLKNINKCNFMRNPKKPNIKIYITLPKLRYIRNGGVGSVTFLNRYIGDSLDIRIGNSGDVSANVDVKYLATSTHGNGDLYLEGKVDFSSHYTNGTNFLHFENLTIKDKIILNSYTIGDCFVNAPTNGVMEMEIWRSGNIYYSGTPSSISVKGTGKGSVIQQ